MKQAVLRLFVVVLAVGLAGLVWAQAQPAVTLEVLNPVMPGTNVAVVKQGDPVHVQYTVNSLMDVVVAPPGLIQLCRIDSGVLISEQAVGGVQSGTVSLSTSPNNAIGDLKAVYIATSGGILAIAPQVVRVTGAGPSAVTVPSLVAPTIQAGIDAVADGGTIQIRPGTYREKLLVAGKRVNLVGSGSFGLRRTLIAGTQPREVVPYRQAQGLISFGPGGGGSIRNLILQGGDAGVVGLEDPGGAPAPVRIEDAVIRMTGHGVLGAFSTLAMDRVVIMRTLDHAVVITDSEALEFFEGIVIDAGGVGIVIYNFSETSGEINIVNQIVGYTSAGGIAIVGGAKPVRIAGCHIGYTCTFGILLSYAGEVEVADSSIAMISYCGPGGGGPGGTIYDNISDGLIARESTYVWIHGLYVSNCTRSGLMFDSSGGLIQNTRSIVTGLPMNSRFGIVVQGEPKPDYSDPTNIFEGTNEPILTDGALPVPEPPPLPGE